MKGNFFVIFMLVNYTRGLYYFSSKYYKILKSHIAVGICQLALIFPAPHGSTILIQVCVRQQSLCIVELTKTNPCLENFEEKWRTLNNFTLSSTTIRLDKQDR